MARGGGHSGPTEATAYAAVGSSGSSAGTSTPAATPCATFAGELRHSLITAHTLRDRPSWIEVVDAT